MKLIKSSAEYMSQEKGREGVYKQIEKAARVCYKSEAKCDGTIVGAKRFVYKLIEKEHTDMLEHGTVYLKQTCVNGGALHKYEKNPYSVVYFHYDHTERKNGRDFFYHTYYVTTNYRVLEENSWLNDLQYICEPTEFHKKRYSLKLTTSIGIVRELLRHRKFSFANESTRYCNYNKDKFDNEITFIEPHWINDHKSINSMAYDNAYEVFISICEEAEAYYMILTESNFSPQQAREVLPLCTKSELIMTGFASDWKHFFDLRLFSKAGEPHPDMKILAEQIKEECIKNNIWDDIINQKLRFE